LALLATDAILWRFNPPHAYALVGFVVVDFVLAAFIAMKPSRMLFVVVIGWSILRMLFLVGDVLISPMGPAQFADYLFNPAGMHPPNPTGIPGALIDLIVLLEIVTIGVSWAGRSAVQK